jgi:hypothetical protein
MRIELPTKVNGSATYAIDVQVPGMVYGAVLRSPVEGGAPDTVDDAAAKAVDGVIDVVRLPYGVGVLAQTPWAAFDAKSALESGVTWRHDGKAWGFDSDKGLDAFAADARNLDMLTTVDWFKQHPCGLRWCRRSGDRLARQPFGHRHEPDRHLGHQPGRARRLRAAPNVNSLLAAPVSYQTSILV